MAALIRNESTIVDNYDLRVVGLPDGWWSLAPATVYLVPFGTGAGRFEQEVKIALHPPRVPAAEAREWPIQVVARSRATGSDVASADAVLSIEPYQELEGLLRPARRSGRRRAQYTLRVANHANAPTKVLLDGIDPENSLIVSFFAVERPGQKAIGPSAGSGMVHEAGRLATGPANPEYMARMTFHRMLSGGALTRIFRRRGGGTKHAQVVGLEVDHGERAQVLVKVTPSRQIIVGRTRLHPFQITAEPTRRAPGEIAGPVVAGAFRQRAWIPWWILILLPLLVGALILFLMTRPKLTTVPNLKATTSTLAAESALRRAHLRLGETLSVTNDNVRAGSVMAQSPAPGTRVEEDSGVTIQLAVSSGKVKVPRIVGLTLEGATTVLTQEGLQLGPSLVAPPNVRTSKITSQAPIEGTVAPQGSMVNPVFNRPDVRRPGPAVPAPALGGGGGSAGPSAGPRVPDVIGKGQEQAAKLVVERGYVPKSDGEYSDAVPAGAIIRQQPAGNASYDKGGTVSLVVSRGMPEVVFDADLDIVGIGGAHGTPRRKIAATADVEIHPTLSADGSRIAYRRGPAATPDSQLGPAQIWIATLADPLSAQPLTGAGFSDRRPAFSPNDETIAFISDRVTPGDDDLCFASLTVAPATVSCIPDPATKVSRPAWAPDGRTILVTANDAQGQVELLRYATANPSSANAADWVPQGFITDAMHSPRAGEPIIPIEQVTSAAFAPDGRTLAFAANWRDGIFKLYLLPIRKGVIGTVPKRIARVRACELGWRPDSAELVVAHRDGSCDGTGQIIRVDVRRPERVRLLTELGRNSGNPGFGATPAK